jgi:acyl carrier protein
MEMEEQIKTFIANNLIYVDDTFDYDNDTSLIGDGLIDSVGVVELIGFVQSSFGITVDQQDSVLENFDSVSKVAAFIRRKQAAAMQKGQPALVDHDDAVLRGAGS